MSELDKLSALINLVQQQNLQMIHQWDILSDYLSNQLIIPTRLKDSVVQSICDLTETESKLQKAIKALNSEWAVNSFADAENALAHLSEEKNNRELAEKINQLVVESNMPVARVSAVLFELEMRNIVRLMAGGRYHLIK